jgi:hypothetical protein
MDASQGRGSKRWASAWAFPDSAAKHPSVRFLRMLFPAELFVPLRLTAAPPLFVAVNCPFVPDTIVRFVPKSQPATLK